MNITLLGHASVLVSSKGNAASGWLSPALGIGVQSERMAFGLEGFVATGAGVPGLVGIDERRTTLVLTLSIPLFDARAATAAKSSAGNDLALAEERSARVKIEAEVL